MDLVDHLDVNKITTTTTTTTTSNQNNIDAFFTTMYVYALENTVRYIEYLYASFNYKWNFACYLDPLPLFCT